MQEFRKHARIKVLIPCGIRIPGGKPPDAWGHIHDISIGGVELHTYFPMSPGDTLFLTFTVEERFQFVNVKTTVVRVRKDEGYLFSGVSFDEIVDKIHLKDAIHSLLDRE